MLELTNYENFYLAEIHWFVDQRKLNNDVSESESFVVDVSTVDSDGGSSRYSARILATQRVVP